MKTHLLIAALLIGVYVPAFAEDHGDAQELLSAAEKQADLFRGAKSPFVLEADFTAQSKTPLKGHITIRWKSKDRWWRKIVLGDYQQINVHDGENLFTARNLGFTPERVGELVNLLQIPTR